MLLRSRWLVIFAYASLLVSCGGGDEASLPGAAAPGPYALPALNALIPQTQLINSDFFGASFGESATVSATQGYATDGTNNYLFSTQTLVQTDAQWHTVYANQTPFKGIALKLDHMGDGEVSNGKIYVPLACATQEACNPEAVAIGVYSADTEGLPLAQWTDITSSGCDGSAIAVGPNNTLYVSNFFANAGFLCMFDATTLVPKGKLNLSIPLPRLQGISFDPVSQRFAVTTDNADRSVGYIYFVSLDGKVFGPAYTAPQKGEMEGLDYTQGYIGYIVQTHTSVYYVFPLQLSGTGLSSASQVDINGMAQPTIDENDSLLDVIIPAALLGSFGQASVSVENPSPGGGSSTTLSFTVSPSM